MTGVTVRTLLDPTLLVVLALACVLAGTGAARAQDLEPKAYPASPVGASFLVLGVSRSSGSVRSSHAPSDVHRWATRRRCVG
jgi:hypothetical protein